MMPSPSGSRITIASRSPIPATNPSIHASYSACVVAPPAENWAQSRNGMLYVTSTGIVRRAAARVTVSRTS